MTLSGKEFDEFRETAFQKLAAYIFGGNQTQTPLDEKALQPMTEFRPRGEGFALTSPALQQKEVTGEWTMSFVLLKKYSFATVPKPLDEEVKLREVLLTRRR